MHLTRSLSLIAALTALAAPAAAAEIGKDLTTGGGVGSTAFSSGLTGKRYLGENKAVQVFLGNGYGVYGGFYGGYGGGYGVSADLVIEKPITDVPGLGKVFWGYGLGAGLSSWYGVGVSGVAELGLHLADFPVEVVTDIRPSFSIAGDDAGVRPFDGGGAVRYYFK
jgi:hypothetical protein